MEGVPDGALFNFIVSLSLSLAYIVRLGLLITEIVD